jgi:hypothetical protein
MELFKIAGIETVSGVEGKIDVIIEKIVDGSLEGGESICKPGLGRGYGVNKTECEDK